MPLLRLTGDEMRKKLRDGCDVLIGNCLNTLKSLPDESIHSCITSPPYYGLRDYGGEEEQIGLEETPEQFIENLVKVFREVKRVLHPSGTLWVNIGDSYWGGKGASGQGDSEYQERRASEGESFNRGHHQIGGSKKTRPTDKKHPVIKPKDLVGIPWRLAFALQADGWYLRQDIIWSKPSCMPESVRDRCTKSHEYIFLLSKSKKYFYDSEAIKEPVADPSRKNYQNGSRRNGVNHDRNDNDLNERMQNVVFESRNKRSVWNISPKPYSEAHFAVFPPELIEPCVLAGTSQGGCCSKCFAPYVKNLPSCDCEDAEQKPCTVLDPFGGSGTTAGVALKHRRNAILCELNDSYVDLMVGRIKAITGLHDGQKTLFTLFQDW